MGYYIDESKIGLAALQKRIAETDLVPSRSLLMENIGENFSALEAHGLYTLEALRKELKNAKDIPSISKKTGISIEYLTLLRREIESFFPKAFPIKAFDWLSQEDVGNLEKHGYSNTVKLFDALCAPEQKTKMLNDLAIDRETLDELSCLADLVRIQWTSLLAAKMMFSAGYRNSREVARADAEKMCDELDRINKEKGFFKGKIGLRDVKRLIKAATYLS